MWYNNLTCNSNSEWPKPHISLSLILSQTRVSEQNNKKAILLAKHLFIPHLTSWLNRCFIRILFIFLLTAVLIVG